MNIVEILDIMNGPTTPHGFKSEMFYELIEAGYDLILVDGQWMLVDDNTYSREIW